MSHQPHYFLALPLSPKMRELLAYWREVLEPRLPFKTWVHQEDYHITLEFLGNASFSQINLLKTKIAAVTAQHLSFELQIDGVGTFGKEDSPRIFWAGVNHSEQLRDLQKDISAACMECGFKVDTRPYNPHITIARKWNNAEAFDYGSIKSIVAPKEEVSWFNVTNVILYQTHLQRVPKYQPLSIFSLSEGRQQ